MQSSTSRMPFGKRVDEGFHNPTLSHQPSPIPVYQPESMQKYSAPVSAAAVISGSSRPVVGLPSSVFM